MRSSVLLSLLTLGAIGVAADEAIQKRSFKVERVRNARFAGHNGPKLLLRTYRKYGMPVPAGLAEAAAAMSAQLADQPITAEAIPGGGGRHKAASSGKGAGNQFTNATAGAAGTGLVPATPEPSDVEYLAPVTIGGQTVNLDFDSGSSDLWVFSTQMPKRQQTGHGVYDPNQSQTFTQLQGSTFSISYGDGSGAAGLVGTDTVEVGGVTFTQQAVELATAVSQEFVDDTNTDGLLGLAFSTLNTVQPQQQTTFFDNVKAQLAEPVFTADLRPAAVGAYEFGRIDATKFTGQMTWIPVNTTQGFWQFASETFTVAGGAVQQGTSGAQAIADTGTTLMLADPALVNAYYSQVPGAANSQTAGGVTVPCDATLPDLTVDVGGVYQAKVKGSDINFAPLGNGQCFGGLQPSPVNLFIYGDIFFKSQFVAFNNGNNTLGMADHA